MTLESIECRYVKCDQILDLPFVWGRRAAFEQANLGFKKVKHR